MPLELLSRQVRGLCKSVTSIRCCTVQLRCWLFPSSDSSTFSGRPTGWPRNSYLLKFQVALFFGWWPTFRFFERWDSTSLSRLRSMDSADARQVLSFSGTGDEKETRRCMSPRLPTLARNKGARIDWIRAKARFELSMLLVRTKTAGQKGAFAHDDYRM